MCRNDQPEQSNGFLDGFRLRLIRRVAKKGGIAQIQYDDEEPEEVGLSQAQFTMLAAILKRSANGKTRHDQYIDPSKLVDVLAAAMPERIFHDGAIIGLVGKVRDKFNQTRAAETAKQLADEDVRDDVRLGHAIISRLARFGYGSELPRTAWEIDDVEAPAD